MYIAGNSEVVTRMVITANVIVCITLIASFIYNNIYNKLLSLQVECPSNNIYSYTSYNITTANFTKCLLYNLNSRKELYIRLNDDVITNMSESIDCSQSYHDRPPNEIAKVVNEHLKYFERKKV